MKLDPPQVRAAGGSRGEPIQPRLQGKVPANRRQEMHPFLARDMQPKWGAEKQTG